MHRCLKGKQLIVFDWDETLMNSREIARRASLQVIADLFGIVDLPPKLTMDLGHSPCVLAMEHFKIETDQDKSAFVGRFIHYHREMERAASLIPDAKRVLQTLRESGLSLAIATGRSRASLQPLMERAGIQGYFSALRCREDPVQKPDASVLTGILTQLNHDRASCLLIGDSRTDMKLASNAGVDFLHATYHAYFELDVPHKLSAIAELVD
ncbi:MULTISPECIES: HAD family hydrolase [Pseudomonas aeruginosa group]|uniref:HAD family hydrolase n=1 Tax=Pseudomonas aeruginosa group TaxID=136841 RepID=UPI0006B27A2B|nr:MULTISPECIES: HAD family hydrolase [Pseudomonas aeruginosa group]KQB29458.1 hypothetical protein AOA77_24240 [Pseudomonas paraeruginosa]MDT1025163.1 HAD family hydrolase [Pseudomonas paraeruginosa]PHJ29109.1 HAD family hydrolase [Pseudomonas paraeruginosa]QQV49743.1 HAD family hydrolase [Pseudomonas aeruginosa]RQF81075.1 HAD family hydrolase [Pseudomonas aeruginosa]